MEDPPMDFDDDIDLALAQTHESAEMVRNYMEELAEIARQIPGNLFVYNIGIMPFL